MPLLTIMMLNQHFVLLQSQILPMKIHQQKKRTMSSQCKLKKENTQTRFEVVLVQIAGFAQDG